MSLKEELLQLQDS